MAQLGAAQVWANSLVNQKQAITDYTNALKLGSKASLPELFKAAGADFRFDVPTLKRSVDLIEQQLELLEKKLAG